MSTKYKYENRLRVAEALAQKRLDDRAYVLTDNNKNNIEKLLDAANKFITEAHQDNKHKGNNKKLFLDIITLWCGEILGNSTPLELVARIMPCLDTFVFEMIEKLSKDKENENNEDEKN